MDQGESRRGAIDGEYAKASELLLEALGIYQAELSEEVPRQSAGGGPGLGKACQDTVFTFEDHCLEGKLAFGNPSEAGCMAADRSLFKQVG